jgi:hypothetical protein
LPDTGDIRFILDNRFYRAAACPAEGDGRFRGIEPASGHQVASPDLFASMVAPQSWVSAVFQHRTHRPINPPDAVIAQGLQRGVGACVQAPI